MGIPSWEIFLEMDLQHLSHVEDLTVQKQREILPVLLYYLVWKYCELILVLSLQTD